MSEPPTETFRPIADFPGYEVSDWGRVRSWLRPGSPWSSGKVGDRYHILKRQHGPGGYLTVPLRRAGEQVSRYVHELVAEAFLGPRPADHEVRHIDGDKTNAMRWNLAWGTHKENEADKESHGTRSRCESHPRARLTREQVTEIRRLRVSGMIYEDIAARFGISKGHAHRLCTSGTAWKGA